MLDLYRAVYEKKEAPATAWDPERKESDDTVYRAAVCS